MPASAASIILVVDDVPKNIQVVGAILRDAGYQIMPASSGPQAFQRIAVQRPDLILLDIMMPDMDGYEVCRRLKADAATASIPVIFLTAATESEQIVEGFRLGAADYLAKPFHGPELLMRVRNHLELKFAREALERTAADLRALNEEKNEFLGIAAHDLKNPLATFVGLADVLIEEPDIERSEIARIARSFKQESRRLATLVQNLLDVNALERGEVPVNPVPCDLLALLARIIKSNRPLALLKGQTLDSDTALSAAPVLADPEIVVSILDNLVSNAIKYSPHGKPIRVIVSAAPGVHRVAVRDEGPGLSEADVKKLFGKFARLTPRPTGGEHSTGLGLSIVKKLTETMKGRVWCESVLGQGSTFLIELPVP